MLWGGADEAPSNRRESHQPRPSSRPPRPFPFGPRGPKGRALVKGWRPLRRRRPDHGALRRAVEGGAEMRPPASMPSATALVKPAGRNQFEVDAGPASGRRTTLTHTYSHFN